MKQVQVPQNKRRKKNHKAGPRTLQQKVKHNGGVTGSALEAEPSLSHKREAVGISLRRNQSSSSVRTSRVFAASTPASATSPQTAPSRRSRFSRPSRSRLVIPSASTHVVCCISENLARETCVASLDAGAPTTMQVTKQGNSQTYAETVAYLEMLRPDEVLLNEGRRSSQLARKILELYEQDDTDHAEAGDVDQDDEDRFGSLQTQTVVKFLPRSLFDQTKGAQFLKTVARQETYDATLLEEYILLSSSYAILHYVQHTLGCTFSKHSVFLSINTGGNNRLAIDRSTMMQLELLVNSKTGKAKDSLVDSIDCTKTTVGSRLLRTNLMSPPMRADTVNSRLDLVDLLLGDPDFFYDVMDHLGALPDVDKMLAHVSLVPKFLSSESGGESSPNLTNQRIASKGVSALVCIKSTLQALPLLAAVLKSQLQKLHEQDGSTHADDATIVTNRDSILIGLGHGEGGTLNRHHLLRAIIFAFTQPGLVQILEAVTEIYSDTSTFSRNACAMRHQECFALKCDDTELMAVYRSSFLKNTEDIYRKADEYAEIYNLPVKVKYTNTRGYFLSIPEGSAADLASAFVQPCKSGRNIYCTTEEVASLSEKVKENVYELLTMTHYRIQGVMEVARQHYDALASVCDAIALLDMCYSFADHVATHGSDSWCRPVVTDPNADAENGTATEPSNTIMIRSGRFPIDVVGFNCQSDNENGSPSLIPNDTYATWEKPFTVITGINGSGKSTYLKQIALIAILAHCGSYVPADKAIVPMLDRLCCRIGTADDQEQNISTFMLEMKETAFICNNATDRSLVLVDELGRATSNEDGVAIAWALAEYLLKQRSLTFFVTHYPQLSCLSTIYPCVQNVHLEASVSRGVGGQINYTHKVKPGACKVATDYGVELASACGWPKLVVDSAREIQNHVAEQLPDDNLCQKRAPEQLPDSTRTTAYDKLVSVTRALRTLSNGSGIQSYASLRSELTRIKEQNLPADDTKLAAAMDQLLFRTHASSQADGEVLQTCERNETRAKPAVGSDHSSSGTSDLSSSDGDSIDSATSTDE